MNESLAFDRPDHLFGHPVATTSHVFVEKRRMSVRSRSALLATSQTSRRRAGA
ncbi:MAG: hypothetical protein IPL43_08745 [Micropruina sp.]|nr:hypothetical protein [Micropruina sp.]